MSISDNRSITCRSLAELKIRSRILLKAAAQEKPYALQTLRKFGKQEPPFQHKDGLKAVSRLAGFKNWQHASHILGGSATIGEDAGVLWYSNKCTGFLNVWCRNYEEAKEQFDQRSDNYLFPYKSQFVVANAEYVRALGLEIEDFQAQEGCRNLVDLYGSSAWDDLTFKRLQKAMGGTSGH